MKHLDERGGGERKKVWGEWKDANAEWTEPTITLRFQTPTKRKFVEEGIT